MRKALAGNEMIGRITLFALAAASGLNGQSVAVARRFSPTDFQIPAIYEAGAPTGSYLVSTTESVNHYNGRLNLTVPLREVRGRGGAAYSIAVPVTRNSWTVDVAETTVTQGSVTSYRYDSAPSVDWRHVYEPKFSPGLLLQKHVGSDVQNCATTGPADLRYRRTFSHLIFLQPDGTETALYGDLSTAQQSYSNGGILDIACPTASLPDRLRGPVFRSRDSQPIVFSTSPGLGLADNTDPELWKAPFDATLGPSGTLRFPDGSRYDVIYGKVWRVVDRNGNRLTFCFNPHGSSTCGPPSATSDVHPTRVVDSMGRVTKFFYDSDLGGGVSEDRIEYPGNGGATRTVRVRSMAYRSRLAAGQSAVAPFSELGGTNAETNVEVTSEIVLPDNRKYEFYYNSYAEVVEAKLPTGGRIEYTYGAGLNNPNNKPGIYSSGQVLSDDATLYGAPNVSFHRPFIYRRLTERREYSTSGATTPVLTTEFSRPETVTDVTPSSANASTIVTAVTIASVSYVEVTEKQGSAVLRKVRHHYFTQLPNSALDYGGAARQLGLTYPAGTGTMAGYAEPFQSPKEHRTETLDGTTVVQEKTAAWALTSNQTAYECTTKETLYQTGLNSAGTLPQLYGLQRMTVTARDGYLNETDRYEFGYTNITSQPTAAPLTCAGTSGYYRRTHTDYKTEHQSAEGPYLVRLPVKESITDGSGAEVAVTE